MAFWWSLASSWMFTVKTKTKWSFPQLRTSGAGCGQEGKLDFSHKMYRRHPQVQGSPAQVDCWSLLHQACRGSTLHRGNAEACTWVTMLHHHQYSSQGWIYRVWPPVSLINGWYEWTLYLPVYHWLTDNTLSAANLRKCKNVLKGGSTPSGILSRKAFDSYWNIPNTEHIDEDI